MIQKLLDIINNFPEFSREYIAGMAREFEKECVLKEIEGINCYIINGNNKIYLVENTTNAFRIAVIKSSKGKVEVNFGVRFHQENEMNFSKAIDETDKMVLWENYFRFVFNKKVEKSRIFFVLPENFTIHNKRLQFFVMKWTMKYLSKKSLVALDISKSLAELDKYENSYFFLPCGLAYAWKEFFEYGTLHSMLSEKLGIKESSVLKKVPPVLVPFAICLYYDANNKHYFIIDEILRKCEILLNKLFKNYSLFCFFEVSLIFYCEIEGLNKKWNFDLYHELESNDKKFANYENLINKVFENSDAVRPKTFFENLKKCETLEDVEKYSRKLERKAQAKRIKETPETPLEIAKKFRNFYFNYLKKELNDAEMIENEKRLLLEGIWQKNCAYSYLETIDYGKCSLFSLEENGKRYTFEIAAGENQKLFLSQCRKSCNKTDEETEKLSERINAIVDEYNRNIDKKLENKRKNFMKNVSNFLNFENPQIRKRKDFGKIETAIEKLASLLDFLQNSEFYSIVKNKYIEYSTDFETITVELKNDVMKIKIEYQEETEIVVTIDKVGELDFSLNMEKLEGIPEYQETLWNDGHLAIKRRFLNEMLKIVYEYYSDKSGLANEIWKIFKGAEKASEEFSFFSFFLLPLIGKKELFKFQNLVDYAKSKGIFEETFELPYIKSKNAHNSKRNIFLVQLMFYQLIFCKEFKNKEFLIYNFFDNNNKLPEIIEIVNELPKTETFFHFLCCYVIGKFKNFEVEINDFEKVDYFFYLLKNIGSKNDNLMRIYELNSIEEIEKLSFETSKEMLDKENYEKLSQKLLSDKKLNISKELLKLVKNLKLSKKEKIEIVETERQLAENEIFFDYIVDDKIEDDENFIAFNFWNKKRKVKYFIIIFEGKTYYDRETVAFSKDEKFANDVSELFKKKIKEYFSNK
jgi:hypothetical protein